MKKRAWIVFFDESGASLLPQVRRTYAPRGRAPTLRHRLNWKRAGRAAALGYHAAGPGCGPRLCFRLKPGSYDTASLIEVLEQARTFCAGEPVVLVWDGLSAHWSRVRRLGGTSLQVLTGIKNRGTEDVCMVVCDGLKGLPDAIGTVWPQAITQCVVHLLAASFRCAARSAGRRG